MTLCLDYLSRRERVVRAIGALALLPLGCTAMLVFDASVRLIGIHSLMAGFQNPFFQPALIAATALSTIALVGYFGLDDYWILDGETRTIRHHGRVFNRITLTSVGTFDCCKRLWLNFERTVSDEGPDRYYWTLKLDIDGLGPIELSACRGTSTLEPPEDLLAQGAKVSVLLGLPFDRCS